MARLSKLCVTAAALVLLAACNGDSTEGSGTKPLFEFEGTGNEEADSSVPVTGIERLCWESTGSGLNTVYLTQVEDPTVRVGVDAELSTECLGINNLNLMAGEYRVEILAPSGVTWKVTITEDPDSSG